MSKRNLTLIMKSADYCNLKCTYCYDGHQKPHDKIVMNQAFASKVIREAYDLSDNFVQIIWHGGEPLLAGKDFFRQVSEETKRLCHSDKKIEYLIQTNGILLDDEWINLFKEYGFKVGVSLDGHPAIHNINRKTCQDIGSYESVIRGINLLQEAKIGFGMLAVVSKASIGLETTIYNHFKSLNLKGFDFCPNVKLNPQTYDMFSNHITPDEYAIFMSKIFDLWLGNGDENIYIRYLSNILDSFLGLPPSLCKLAGTCSSYFFTINSSGNVFPCDGFVGIDSFYLGNLKENPLQEIIEGQAYQNFRSLHQQAMNSCKECQWFFCCNGGCSYERYIVNHDLSRNYLCEANKKLFEHIYMRVSQIWGNCQ